MSGLEIYRRKVSESKRRSIMEAAREAFRSEGYVSANMAQIARKADVSTATLYKHCDGKEDLFCKVISSLPSDEARRAYVMYAAIGPLWEAADKSADLTNTLGWLSALVSHFPQIAEQQNAEEAEAVA